MIKFMISNTTSWSRCLKQENVNISSKNLVKKISFLTGAGISTSAGIPDFRSNTGLFKVLQEKYNLSSPEEFFHIETFRNNPEYFYEWSKETDLTKYDPTPTHWFMSFLEKKGLLNIIYTQNIDALELKAKVSREKMVFAHGYISAAHCSKCKTEKDLQLFTDNVKAGKVLYCNNNGCMAPVKPVVVLYGENLPSEVNEHFHILADSDLVFIMGTSLKVMPFSFFPHQLDKSCQRVLVNMEQVGGSSFKFNDICSPDCFIEGKTDEIVHRLVHDLGWKDEFEEHMKSNK
jgi:NAD-dependent histone deacetylase SIR2